MAGVTSVRFEKIDPKRGGAILLIVIALLLLIGPTRGFGALLLVLGIAWIVTPKPEFAVTLNSASGEVRAIQRKNSQLINGIVKALNDAIVYRR